MLISNKTAWIILGNSALMDSGWTTKRKMGYRDRKRKTEEGKGGSKKVSKYISFFLNHSLFNFLKHSGQNNDNSNGLELLYKTTVLYYKGRKWFSTPGSFIRSSCQSCQSWVTALPPPPQCDYLQSKPFSNEKKNSSTHESSLCWVWVLVMSSTGGFSLTLSNRECKKKK